MVVQKAGPRLGESDRTCRWNAASSQTWTSSAGVWYQPHRWADIVDDLADHTCGVLHYTNLLDPHFTGFDRGFMSVINRLAHSLGRRDEVPNQELARDLAAKKNIAAIKEIVENLANKDKNIQADCIKVLYEIGVIDPDLIADYAEDFVKLLMSKNNRLA